LLKNFVSAIQAAQGTYFRWIGDDDRLEPDFVSRCLECFADDERRLLVTTRIDYTNPAGVTESDQTYVGRRMDSPDRLERLEEILRLLNESYLLVDPLYGLHRRAPVADMPRRNMLREDEVFAARLAIAGPWGHVPSVLAHRNFKTDRMPQVARRLDVPVWQANMSNTLECREILRWIDKAGFAAIERRRAKAAVGRMYIRRQRKIFARRSRRLTGLAASTLRWGASPGSHQATGS